MTKYILLLIKKKIKNISYKKVEKGKEIAKLYLKRGAYLLPIIFLRLYKGLLVCK